MATLKGIKIGNTTADTYSEQFRAGLLGGLSAKTETDTVMVNHSNKLYSITNANLLNYILPKNAGAHNSVFRGKNLTNQLDATYTAIANGTFDDVFVGDYFTKTVTNVNGTSQTATFRIAHLDKYLNRGDTVLTRHHAVVIPDDILGSAQMNSENVTTGAYVGSQMYTKYLNPTDGALTSSLKTAFGDHLISHRAVLSNATSNGSSSGWAWYDSYADLMTEEEVYGVRVWGGGTHDGFDVGIDYGQMALFSLSPSYICNRSDWWLRSVGSATYFCLVVSGGHAGYWGASSSLGVRPRFLIG